MTVRVRFAPSPTGRLHLGNARVAVFNWLFARRHGGAFILRIEDTDRERHRESAEDGIRADLAWLGLDPDEGPAEGGEFGPYRQSERSGIYVRALADLIEAGSAFPCFCDPGESTTDRRYNGRCREMDPGERERRIGRGEAHAVRFASPERGTVVVRDSSLAAGEARFPAADIDDFVLRRARGGFTYNFVCAVDDARMDITHVIRGAGHLSNTPKQALMLGALAAEPPSYAHLPTLLAPDGGKLSKRSGATPVSELEAGGFPADAVVNYLSLLGWSHPDQREFLGRRELIDSISLKRVGRSEVRTDPKKMLWLSRRHIAAMPLDELARILEGWYDRSGLPEGSDWKAGVDALRPRFTTYACATRTLGTLYGRRTEPAGSGAAEAESEERRVAATTETVVEAVNRALRSETDWSPERLRPALLAAGKSVGARGPGLFHPIRRRLTGREVGPDVIKLLLALGRKEVLKRLAPPAPAAGPSAARTVPGRAERPS